MKWMLVEAELREMLTEAVRSTQPELKRPPKANKDRDWNDARRLTGLLAAAAAHDGANPGFEFGGLKRLEHVVIGANVQSVDTVIDLVARR